MWRAARMMLTLEIMKTLDTLVRLLTEARSEADRLGPCAKAIAQHLGEALTEARALAAHNGRPDEGKRPEELSSANDG